MTDSLRTSSVHDCPTERKAALARRNATVTLGRREVLTAENALMGRFPGCGVWHASRHSHVPDTHNPGPCTNWTDRGRQGTVMSLSKPRGAAAQQQDQ